MNIYNVSSLSLHLILFIFVTANSLWIIYNTGSCVLSKRARGEVSKLRETSLHEPPNHRSLTGKMLLDFRFISSEEVFAPR